MVVVAKVLAVALIGVLAGCTSSSGRTPSPSSSAPAAHAGLGGPSGAVTVVDEAYFRTPSKNIVCALTTTSVRCDIIRKDWQPPPKPADCELDWGFGMHIDNGKAGFLCAGDSVIGTAKTTLEYGHALRAGDLLCDSESSSLRCSDGKSGHGFALAVAQYTLF